MIYEKKKINPKVLKASYWSSQNFSKLKLNSSFLTAVLKIFNPKTENLKVLEYLMSPLKILDIAETTQREDFNLQLF